MEEIIKERIKNYVGNAYFKMVELKFDGNDLEISTYDTFYGIEMFLDVVKVFYKLNYVLYRNGRIILRCYN